jgi:type II secretory pathway component PulF
VCEDCELKYRIKNWLELSIFTENLGKMLDDGLMFDKAFDIAGRDLASSTNRRLVADLKKVFLGHAEAEEVLARYHLPQFYLALFKCGELTGRWPKALRDAAGFTHQLAPVLYRLHRCWLFVGAAYLISLIFKWVFLDRPQFLGLAVVPIIFLLPLCSETFRYYRDWLTAKLPFIGTWQKQLALMQFFVCLEIAYDSTLSVREMFLNSISAIDNRFFRRQMLRSVNCIDERQSFAASLHAAPFIPRGISALVHTHEISGRLADCFHELSSQLKKIAEAKLEVLKYFSAGIAINSGLFFPLLLILPYVLPKSMLWAASLIILYMIGFVPIACARAAFRQYCAKSAGLNLWYERLRGNKVDY